MPGVVKNGKHGGPSNFVPAGRSAAVECDRFKMGRIHYTCSLSELLYIERGKIDKR